jgi:hypothetical protein
MGGKMEHLLVKTDTGHLKIIQKNEIFFVDGTDTLNIYLKQVPNVPVRVKINIKDFHRVLIGEVDFFDVFQDVEEVISGVKGKLAEEDKGELSQKGLLKNEVADEKEVEQVKKEFLAGKKLVKGTFDKAELVSEKEKKRLEEETNKRIAEELGSDPDELPSFSMKRKQRTKEETKKSSNTWG